MGSGGDKCRLVKRRARFGPWPDVPVRTQDPFRRARHTDRPAGRTRSP